MTQYPLHNGQIQTVDLYVYYVIGTVTESSGLYVLLTHRDSALKVYGVRRPLVSYVNIFTYQLTCDGYKQSFRLYFTRYTVTCLLYSRTELLLLCCRGKVPKR